MQRQAERADGEQVEIGFLTDNEYLRDEIVGDAREIERQDRRPIAGDHKGWNQDHEVVRLKPEQPVRNEQPGAGSIFFIQDQRHVESRNYEKALHSDIAGREAERHPEMAERTECEE